MQPPAVPNLRSKSSKRLVVLILSVIFVVLPAAYFVPAIFLIQTVKVEGMAMYPTLVDGDAGSNLWKALFAILAFDAAVKITG